MECNKEEGLRAKELAEMKMNNKDYAGARTMVIKAQRLFPSIENISHMLTVCQVHCSAECKVLGSYPDWYGILQIEQNADEASIKKQFRKLALQFHPDKNKFPGAEAAFKLIEEAQRFLCDQSKRSQFDMKLKTMRHGQ
ncbi:dnaJ homolog subfamily B member 12-like [Papaver somniferum]|uniref:dnaJ homolog subfamily B member 12-like n=1 Tax=Papaver somniferum TaxID=3469 RepID=UPI000E7043B1|nr:dnaJ homolog subfamily B member 12-like [Papaver somniferum]